MSNHLHVIAESDGREALSRGMQAFATRLGKAINRVLERRGSVFAGRYHARALATPTEVRNALRYVLLNARHHAHETGRVLPAQWIDPCSTAVSFDGWARAVPLNELLDLGTSPARSWLLRIGWRRLGLLDPAEVPGAPNGASVTHTTPLRRAA
ncbi:MAG: hypothetical protein IAG13_31075 [Deltaproteobacteria bacterium]|nr:hypothetical protein [Nannocystaceae bacterium]